VRAASFGSAGSVRNRSAALDVARGQSEMNSVEDLCVGSPRKSRHRVCRDLEVVGAIERPSEREPRARMRSSC
jgi:hypothetical protein